MIVARLITGVYPFNLNFLYQLLIMTEPGVGNGQAHSMSYEHSGVNLSTVSIQRPLLYGRAKPQSPRGEGS
jgi:hypothetical protein